MPCLWYFISCFGRCWWPLMGDLIKITYHFSRISALYWPWAAVPIAAPWYLSSVPTPSAPVPLFSLKRFKFLRSLLNIKILASNFPMEFEAESDWRFQSQCQSDRYVFCGLWTRLRILFMRLKIRRVNCWRSSPDSIEPFSGDREMQSKTSYFF